MDSDFTGMYSTKNAINVWFTPKGILFTDPVFPWLFGFVSWQERRDLQTAMRYRASNAGLVGGF